MRTTTRCEPGRWDGALVFIESRPSRLFLLQNGDETKQTLAVLSLFRNAEPDETITDDEELLTGWHNIAMANLYSPAFFTWICCPLSLANSSPGSVVLSLRGLIWADGLSALRYSTVVIAGRRNLSCTQNGVAWFVREMRSLVA